MTDTAARQDQGRARRGRLGVNLMANLSSFGLQLVIGIWFVPYLVRHLGVAGYGLIPLATQVTHYMRVVTLAFNSAVGRFLTIASEKADDAEANRIFNTSLVTTVGLCGLLLPLAAAGVVHVDQLIEVPPGYATEARWLLAGTVGMFLLMTLAAPFQVSTFTQNRFDVRTGVDVLAVLGRVGLIVGLFVALTPRVAYAGLGYAAAGAITFVGAVVAWRFLTPQLAVRPRDFDRRMLGQLSGMGVWVVINILGTILFLQIDLMVVNHMVGPEAGGEYALVLQWSTLLRGFAAAVAAVFGPTLVYYYAREDLLGLVAYARRAVKLVGLAVALPVGLICGFSRPLLSVWVGPEHADLAPLMSLVTCHLCVNLGYLPLHGITTAANRVRWPGITSLLMGAANLGLALLLCGPADWGMVGVAAAGAITITAKNILFTPLYAAHVLGRPAWTFMRELLPTSLATALLIGGGWGLSTLVTLDSWLALIAAGAATSGVYGAMVFFVLLDDEERAQVRARIRR
jgi:membrane protein EpsK